MSRIRSVKPEYFTDGKIDRLSDSAALLFIALWTQSDDYGFFSCDTRELGLKVPRWRSQSLFKMLCALADHGLIRVCTPLAVAQITSWDHQKIKDRRLSKWKDMEIKWDEKKVDAQGSDRIRLGSDLGSRIGSDRKGSERIGSYILSTGATPPPDPVDPTPPDVQVLDHWLLTMWNELCGTLPKAKAFGKERQKLFAKRFIDHPDRNDWADAITAFSKSPHHTGKNDSGWMADLDFLLQSKKDRVTQGLEMKVQVPRIQTFATKRGDNLDLIEAQLREKYDAEEG